MWRHSRERQCSYQRSFTSLDADPPEDGTEATVEILRGYIIQKTKSHAGYKLKHLLIYISYLGRIAEKMPNKGRISRLMPSFVNYNKQLIKPI